MIADTMPLQKLLPHNIRIIFYKIADIEESSLDIIYLQDGQYLRRIDGIWSIVEGQGDFRQMCVAVEHRITEGFVAVLRGVTRCQIHPSPKWPGGCRQCLQVVIRYNGMPVWFSIAG